MALPPPLARVAQALLAETDVELAVAFGSLARGDGEAGSDLDLGLRLGTDTGAARRALEARLGRAAQRAVDLVFLDDAPPLLRFEIARDGIVLRHRHRHLWVDFKTRAMLDWWDWAPTARRMHRAYVERLRRKVADGQP